MFRFMGVRSVTGSACSVDGILRRVSFRIIIDDVNGILHGVHREVFVEEVLQHTAGSASGLDADAGVGRIEGTIPHDQVLYAAAGARAESTCRDRG